MDPVKTFGYAALTFLALYLIGHVTYKRENMPASDPFENPYTVTILDDHSVQLASKSDTLVLILENSATFNEEYVVFIKK